MLAALTLPDGTACSMHYRRWGHENAATTLFAVHGLTRNSRDFEKLALVAARNNIQIIAPDMPGRGDSPNFQNPALYNNMVYAMLCQLLIKQLGLKDIAWLGTSMGGMIALLVAAQAPGLIRTLILNDVGCVVTAASLRRIGDYVGSNPVFSTLPEAEKLLAERTASFGIRPEDWADFAAGSITHTHAGYRLSYDPAIATIFKGADTTKDIELWPLWEAVKTIPTLLIRGEHSDLLTEETAQKMQATHPNLTRYNVANAGHAPALLTDTEISAVLAFLR